jgi:hypothetical protein
LVEFISGRARAIVAQMPRRDFFSVLTGGTCSGIEARIGSIAWRTISSGVEPAARAFARSFASSAGGNGIVRFIAGVPSRLSYYQG